MDEKLLIGFLATIGLIGIDDLSSGHGLHIRSFSGAIIAYIFLAFMAPFAPKFVGPFAALIFLAVLLQRGGNVLQKLNIIGRTPPA